MAAALCLAGVGYLTCAIEPNTLDISPEAATVLGLASGPAVPRQTFLSAVLPEDRVLLAAALDEPATIGGGTLVLRLVGAACRHARLTLQRVVARGGCGHEIFGVVQDITAAHQATDQPLRRKSRYRDFAAAALDFFWETDAQHRLTHVSDGVQRLTGVAAAALIGQPLFALASVGIGDYAVEQLRLDMAATQPFREHTLCCCPGPGACPRMVEFSGLPQHDATGAFLGYRGSGRDATRTHEIGEQFRMLASSDALTGLINRNSMKANIFAAVAEACRSGKGVAILLFNLRRFKLINDTMGSHVGDQLLMEIANRLEQVIGARGVVGRVSGDEFAVLLRGLEQPVRDARAAATRIMRKLERAYEVDGDAIELSVRAGIAVGPEDGDQGEVLLRNADFAVNAARRGQRSVELFDQKMRDRVDRRAWIERAMPAAIERGDLSLVYQPQVDAVSGALVGLESLMRWKHDGKHVIPPSEFIPIAEEYGHIVDLGRWALDEAVRQLAAWCRAGIPLPVLAINFSPVQFWRDDICGQLRRVLDEHGLQPSQLEVELTEGVLMRDDRESKRLLSWLHETGIRLALDDFGTGYSSLGYLRRYSIDRIKIDQSFVRNICTNRDDQAIVRGMIQLAHSLDIEVLAEGVEREEQQDLLRQMGCDIIQGWLHAKALTPRQLVAWHDERYRRATPAPSAASPPYTSGGGPRRFSAATRVLNRSKLKLEPT